MNTKKKRYALVGAGGRSPMFLDPLARDYRDEAELVALCDVSLVRMQYHRQRLESEYGCHNVSLWPAAQFEVMIRETQPDVVIVCSTDNTHYDYTIRAMRLGCEVITEKPMTTDADQCRAVLATTREVDRRLTVSLNARWSPGAGQVRELIASGVIGQVKSVVFEDQLDTSHGADYFRRWHADKEKSGGLLVHKSSHYFDLVNWWIDAIPEEVFAWGGLKFYGRENAVARREEKYSEYALYRDAAPDSADPFAFSLESGPLKGLYRDAEEETGYLRDRNVFREDITTEDTLSVMVRYRNGAQLSYILVAYSPLEGHRVTFTGDRGRIEFTEMNGSHLITGLSDIELETSIAGSLRSTLRVFPMFQPGYEVEIATAAGEHGGADPLLQRQLFSRDAPHDELCRLAGPEQGAASVLVGIGANQSIATGRPVCLGELCSLRPNAQKFGDLS